MVPVGSVNQLRRDSNAIGGAPHAAFKNRLYIQGFCDLPDVLFLPAERKGGGPRRYLQPRYFREQVQDLFGQSVAEVLVLLVRAHIGEGKNRDGWKVFSRLEYRLFQGLLQRSANFAHRLKPVRWRLAYAAGDDG